MKVTLRLYIDDELKQPYCECFNNSNSLEFQILLCLNLKNNLIDTLILNDDLNLRILQTINQTSDNNNFVSKLNNFENLVEFVDEVHILSSYHDNKLNYKDMVKYIKNNPILKTKKIILNPKFDLDIEKIEEVNHYFKEFSNIYVKLYGNELAVKIEDSIKTVNIIDKISNKIKSYNFSPLEQIMYTYDFVRDRFYVEENKNDPYEISRDLTAVLLGDKIVCLGFSKIFDCIMKKLGFNSSIYYLGDKLNSRPSHARNVVYLKDDKYNINGVYFFDTTWDCKKDDDNSFLYSYKYFAKTKQLFDEYDFEGDLTDITFYNFSINKAWEVEQFLTDDRYKDIPNNYITAINKVSELIDKGQLKLPNIFNNMPEAMVPNYDNINFITNKLYDYAELLDQQLDFDKFVRTLYNVRKCQNHENPNKYPFDSTLFREVINNSCDEKFEIYPKKNDLDKKIKLLKILRR